MILKSAVFEFLVPYPDEVKRPGRTRGDAMADLREGGLKAEQAFAASLDFGAIRDRIRSTARKVGIRMPEGNFDVSFSVTQDPNGVVVRAGTGMVKVVQSRFAESDTA